MKIITVVGARPNFMKAAPIIAAIREHNQLAGPQIAHLLVHTGQHYDAAMSDAFFADLNLPAPDIRLDVGSAPAPAQTAEILTRFAAVLLRERPDAVIVVGDVNSTLACALATAKTAFDSAGGRPLLAHVEAGLRSFDRSMPEEINRVVTDHLADFLFVTEQSGIRNLRAEGVPEARIHFVGNTMIDSLFAFKDRAEQSTILERLALAQPASNGGGRSVAPYALLTLHRPSNVDRRESLLEILAGLADLAGACPIVFPVHPRTRLHMQEFGLENPIEERGAADGGHACRAGLLFTEPLGYLDFLCLMMHAAVIVTDSGGIQEETTGLGAPCVTVRENTERPATIEQGTNVLAGTRADAIQAAIRRQMRRKGAPGIPEKWDGHAAVRIVQTLAAALQKPGLATAQPAPEPHPLTASSAC